MKKLALFLLKSYQKYLSPLKGATCRFYPSCSQYTIDAIKKYGVGQGCFLGIKRIVKCHPWHPGGYDPVK
ncbi:MAG: membrane protein insertion efficiency factor YidD [Peptococcia bacterium]|jgi:putative membrane protein insertion efficiency factor